MNTACKRDGEDALQCADQYGNSLTGVPHGVVGFGIGLRRLMEAFAGRHFLARF